MARLTHWITLKGSRSYCTARVWRANINLNSWRDVKFYFALERTSKHLEKFWPKVPWGFHVVRPYHVITWGCWRCPAAGFSVKQEFCRPNRPSLLRGENFGTTVFIYEKHIYLWKLRGLSEHILSLCSYMYPVNSNMNSVLRRSHM